MKNTTLLFTFIISCFLCKISYTQAPGFQWAKSAGGLKRDGAMSVAVNNSGNIYIAGVFLSPTINFGPLTLTDPSGDCTEGEIFLIKFDANGNALWGKSEFAGVAQSLAVDASGNIYMTGYFWGPSITFGSITLTMVSGSNGYFLVKYNANGDVLWAKGASGSNAVYSRSVAVDPSGNAFVTGTFLGPNITFGTIALTSDASNSDYFMVKYDADGNVKWAKSAGNISPYSLSVAVDASGFAFVTGYFTGSTITFGSHTLNTAGLFFVKYDINGNAIWAKGTVGASPNSVAVDTSGNIYMTGDMNGTSVIFDTITLTNPSLFIAKYNSDGNIVWAKSADGMNNSSPSSIALDISGNAYITGHYFGSITLGSTTLTNTNPGGTGAAYMFVAKYDTIGNVLWAKSAGGLNDTRASSVAVSVIGDAVYTTGSTYYTLSFGNNISYFDCNTIWNAGDYDIFLAKLDTNAGSGINLLINPTAISLFPNPTANYVTIENPNTTTKDFTLSITNIQGQQLLSEKVVIDKTHTIDLSKFPNGIYFLTLQNEKENYMSKVVVQR